MTTRKYFLEEYIKATKNGDAAVFAGAGLSRPSGFADWKDFLRPLAEEIGLKIEDGNDLTLVAQYIFNKAGNRGKINKAIMDAFNRDVAPNENISILTRLPIKTYWTTNYDHLIEDGLREAKRNPDVKKEYTQLSTIKGDRAAIVYKMHGDVDDPANAVLTKDDYIKYDTSHPLFRELLQGDLISKTFLFVGFSFEDPNLDNVIRQTCLRLDNNVRNHFCIMKTIKIEDCNNEEEFKYKKTQQDLREADLARQGIQIVYIEDYSEITDILREIEAKLNSNNVFISGSTEFYDSDWTKDRVEELAYKLSNQLVKSGYRVTSGFGLGVGSAVINGALDEIDKRMFTDIDAHLCLRPFPQNISNPEERARKWKEYREKILAENRIAVFMCGNKKDSQGKKIEANGCWQEYEIARKKGCLIIPIGSTGDVANKILQEMKGNEDLYAHLEGSVDILEKEKNVDMIVEIVLKIVSKCGNLD